MEIVENFEKKTWKSSKILKKKHSEILENLGKKHGNFRKF
jgi:hypothetical protein